MKPRIRRKCTVKPGQFGILIFLNQLFHAHRMLWDVYWYGSGETDRLIRISCRLYCGGKGHAGERNFENQGNSLRPSFPTPIRTAAA